jgi:hypothetical protein
LSQICVHLRKSAANSSSATRSQSNSSFNPKLFVTKDGIFVSEVLSIIRYHLFRRHLLIA